jgi:hypothetical protein
MFPMMYVRLSPSVTLASMTLSSENNLSQKVIQFLLVDALNQQDCIDTSSRMH